MAAALRVLITRPAEQAGDWVERLAGEGIEAAALPLLGIVPVDDAQPVVEAWGSLSQRDLAMFVSANAVAHFFARRPAGVGWPAQMLAAAPGPGTSAALRAVGVPAAQVVEPAADAPSFDSESLWAELSRRGPWAGRSVLIVRGGREAADEGAAVLGRSARGEAEGEGREWLSQMLRGQGAQVDAVATYRRGAPRWNTDEQAVWQQALATPRRHVWSFSSSEAIAHLQSITADQDGPGAELAPWRESVALATHPRIAEAARRAGFQVVLEVAPLLAPIVAAVRSLQCAPLESKAP
jgi:uroporphyrinogen-III synthase